MGFVCRYLRYFVDGDGGVRALRFDVDGMVTRIIAQEESSGYPGLSLT